MRLTGKFKTAFPNGKPEEKKDDASQATKPRPKPKAECLKETKDENTVILVGDADMLFDSFAIRQMQSPFGNMSMAMNGNLNFAQNAVEQLTGDNNLIAVRSRGVQNRPFTLVKKMQAEAEDNYRSKIKELEDSLAETQRQLNELQQKKDKGQRFILSPEQQQAVENFRKERGGGQDQAQGRAQETAAGHRFPREPAQVVQHRRRCRSSVSASGLVLAMYKRKRTAAK